MDSNATLVTEFAAKPTYRTRTINAKVRQLMLPLATRGTVRCHC